MRRTFTKIRNLKKMFAEFDICYRMASLRKFYSMTLIYVLKVNIFLMLLSLKL